MLSAAAINVFGFLCRASKDSLGKAWIEDLRVEWMAEEALVAAVEELAEQGSVVLSRDDMSQRPDALTVGDSQLIELAKEAR